MKALAVVVGTFLVASPLMVAFIYLFIFDPLAFVLPVLMVAGWLLIRWGSK